MYIKLNIRDNQEAGRGDKQEAVYPEQIIGRLREAEAPLAKGQKAPLPNERFFTPLRSVQNDRIDITFWAQLGINHPGPPP